MLKFNKLFCLLLVAVLIPFGSVGTFASDLVDDSAYLPELEFVSNLGIIKSVDTSDLNRTITRAEFVSMVVKMLNISYTSANDGTFTDVEADNPYSSDIFTAYRFGLLKGTSQTTFSPDAPINYAAAIKILVAALGYEEYAFLKGGYPAGYIMQAHEVGISDGITTATPDASVSLGDAIKLISNSLTSDIRVVNSVYDDYYQTTVVDGVNCLTQYFGLTHISGVVTTAGYHSLIHGYNEEDSFFAIGGQSFKTSIPNAERFLGYDADAWYDKDTKTVVTSRLKDTNVTITVNAEDVVSYDNFKLTRQTDESGLKTKTYSLDRGYSFVLNGRLYLPQPSDFTFDNGTLTLIDNNGDGKYDIVKAVKKSYVVVRGFNSSTKNVYDQKMGDIGLVLSNEDGHHYTMTKDGIAADESIIAPNVVLEAAISGDGYLADVEVCTLSVKGKVTEIGEEFITIDNTSYEKTEYFNTYFTPKLGQSGTFLLDSRSRLVYISGMYFDAVQYGYFLDYATSSAGLDNSRVYIKVFTEADEVKTFELTEKITFDGRLVKCTDSAIKNKLEPDPVDSSKKAVPVYQLIRFATDANGFVKLIDTASELDENITDPMQKYAATVSAEDSLTRYVNATKPIDSSLRPKLVSNAYWRKVGNAFIPHFTLGNTVMIEVPKDLRENNAPDAPYDEKAFRIIGTGNLPNYEYVFVDAFDYDDSMIPRVVVLYRGNEKSGETKLVEPDVHAPVHLVEKVVDCITDDGMNSKRLYSYADNKFHITDIAPEVVDSLVSESRIPNPGEVVRLAFSGNQISGIARDIRDVVPGSVTVNTADSNIGKTCTSTHTYITGKVFSCTDGSNIVIQYDFYPMPEEGTTDYTNSPYAFPEDGLCSIRVDSSATIAIYNVATGLVEHADVSKIADIRSVGEDSASYICVALNGYDPEMVVIYR